MSRRFDRRVRVTVASRLGSKSHDSAGRFFNAFTRSTKIEDLRVKFDILKTLSQDANKATITIVNAAAGTRAEFATLPAHVTLDAGYENDLHTIYKGDLISGDSHRARTEWLTELQAGTGANAIKHARVRLSIKKGASTLDQLKSTAATMGLKIPTSASGAKEFQSTLANGGTVQGPSMRAMQRLVRPHGFSASIQDDQLVILADGTRSIQSVVVSQETGMIGTPELGTPDKKGGVPTLKVKMLLSAGLSPGGVIVLKAERVSGNFKVQQVRHIGDTRAQPWYSEIEATPL